MFLLDKQPITKWIHFTNISIDTNIQKRYFAHAKFLWQKSEKHKVAHTLSIQPSIQAIVKKQQTLNHLSGPGRQIAL